MSVPFSIWKAKIRRLFTNSNDAKQETEDTVKMIPPRRPPVLQPIIKPDICKDGTIMLFPTNQKGSQFVLGNKDPNHLKDFSTDSHNRFIMKKESNIQFWNVFWKTEFYVLSSPSLSGV